jgi:hypothetical protein
MLIAGMDTRDPVLRQKLAAKLKSHLKGIARGRFSLPDSFSLMAIPDPSDTLEEGEVAVYLQGSVWVEDRILVLVRAWGTENILVLVRARARAAAWARSLFSCSCSLKVVIEPCGEANT